jgi:hypothetical protein
MIGEHHALVGGKVAERESGLLRGDRRRQTHGKAELDSEFEVDIEELGTQRDRREVRCEMGHVDVPGEGSFDLGAALAQHLVDVCVLPQVGDVTGEARLAAEQRRGVGDGAEPVCLVFAVEREVHANVVDRLVAERGIAGPWCGNHDRRTCGDAIAQRAVDSDVGRVARAQVVTRDDDQLGVVVVSESFGERGHQQRRLSRTPNLYTGPTDRCCLLPRCAPPR